MKIKDYIIVKDNFFTKDVLKNIYDDISKLKFKNRYVENKNNEDDIYLKIYFQVILDKKHFAVQQVLKNVENLIEEKLKIGGNYYFLSTKHKEATPHKDGSDVNCLIYLKGKELINSGTGFYDINNNECNLNTHVGFKENRAIIFDSKIMHASLQFNENCGTRYVMANFFNYET